MFASPLQEFLVRGILQGTLEEFLIGKYRVLLAILISNLIFSFIHLPLSMFMVALTFFAGLFWGWLYSRQKSILGVSISHFILGIWAESIVGLT